MSNIQQALGNAIREVREDRCISQEKLAEEAGLHRTYISSAENGHRNISLSNIFKIARALGVSMTELIRLCEDRLENE